MTNLDEPWDPPTRKQLEDGGCVTLGDKPNDPVIALRSVCGARGYTCVASFVDQEGFGGGSTARAALLSLARSLRVLADRVEEAARKR